MDLASQTATFAAIVAAVVLAFVIALAIWRINRDIRRHRAALQSVRERELATISEDVKLTAVGLLSVVLLVVTIFTTAAAYSRATTVLQQIEAGVAFLGACVILGLGAALGRRRTYTIHRSEQREPY